MRVYHGRSIRKMGGTGGRKRKSADKKLAHVGSEMTATKVGEKQVVELARGRGGTIKARIRYAPFVNVATGAGAVKKAKIRTVLETLDNRHYARQNILTKGAVVDTELGKVKITNRPGQHGVVNGVLLKA
jgi:small subunit ribosomal protein S8e